jgi:hypothetical protein
VASSRDFTHIYEPSFDEDRAKFGLTGRNFDYFFSKVEDYIDANPWDFSAEVPGGEGIRVLPTMAAFPDIPAFYLYFSVAEEGDLSEIHYLGLSPVWSQWSFAPGP